MLQNSGTSRRSKAIRKYSMCPLCSGSNAPSTIATWPRYRFRLPKGTTIGRRSAPDEQPFVLELGERLVEEVDGEIRRALRPLDQLVHPLVERYARGVAEGLAGTGNIGQAVPD